MHVFEQNIDEFNFSRCDIENPFLELMQLIFKIKDLLTVLFVHNYFYFSAYGQLIWDTSF